MRARFVNESLSSEEKREEVMRILADKNLTVPHDSYLKFISLCKTNLSAEKIVRKLLKESVNFEKGRDPKDAMKIGYKNYSDYIERELGEEEANDFWEAQYNLVRDQKPGDLMEDYLDLLYKVPIEDQIEWAKNRLDWWKEAKEEGWV